MDGEIEYLRTPLDLLCSAGKLPHLNGNLLEHLVGTWRILHAGMRPSYLCLAGFLHSIYSTEHYPYAALKITERNRVRKAVGARAEKLAYLFCVLEKRHLWTTSNSSRFHYGRNRLSGEQVRIAVREYNDLQQLECANYIEQCSEEDGSPRPFMAWYLDLQRKGRLPERADAESKQIIEEDERISIGLYRTFWMSKFNAIDALDNALIHNPHAAELYLFKALLTSTSGGEAAPPMEKALELFRFWGTAWDKRIAFDRWVTWAANFRNCPEPLPARRILIQLEKALCCKA